VLIAPLSIQIRRPGIQKKFGARPWPAQNAFAERLIGSIRRE
jgi:hypothetical protein